MEIKWKANPNYRSPLSTREIMKHLTIALAVVYVFGLARSFVQGTKYGINAIIMMVVALVCALGTEAIWAKVQKQDIKTYLKNSFGWITAMIIVLCSKNTVTPYAIGVVTIIAIFFGKLIYGGFGQNVFNPAGVGRALLATSFTTAVISDAVTGATPTATLASAGWLMKAPAFESFLQNFGGLANFWIGWYDGALGETSALLLILVAIYLAYKKVIDWRITVTYIGVIFLGTTIMGLVNGVGMMYPLAFVSTGGIFFAGVFMLTDPVTCPNTRSGKIVFATFAALMTVIIRLFASLPEGVVFSILLANLVTPVIEKIFTGKQVDREKKLNIWVPIFVAAVVAGIALCATGLTQYKNYTTVKAGLDLDTSTTAAGTVYEVQGFPSNDPNKIAVEVVDGKITSVTFVEFNDTEGIGDAANTPDYLAKYVGLSTADEVNAVDAATGASYTTAAVKDACIQALGGK